MPRKNLDINLIEGNNSDLTFFNIDEEENNETLKALKQSYVTTNYKEETILNLQKTLNSKGNNSDLTFFNIDEEENNETLKALKQSYVTTNYKEETILNLQKTLNSNSKETSKELKLESYKRYNNALDLAEKNYITSACDLVEKALEINPKDSDILNLKGLLKLLKCDFSKSFESFYTSMCYGNNDLSRKYVDILSSDEFKVFLSRYNHSIRFINEDLNNESIQILSNIIEENPEFIEPYVILSLIYNKLGNTAKREHYLLELRNIDKDNDIFEEKIEDKEESNHIEEKTPKKKNFIPYIAMGCLVLGMGIFYINSKNKIEKLNNQIIKNEEQLNKANQVISDTNEELNKANQIISDTNKELNKANKELNKVKNEQSNSVVLKDEETLYKDALNLKKENKYEDAIKIFKNIVSNGKSKKYISESIYQVAFLSEKIKNNEDAIKYYKKYINTYTSEDQYYDDSFYQLGMLYYNIRNLKDAQETFYGLKNEVPNSMYNNSKVNEILKER